ncbi:MULTISPECIES: FHA domain-containing protein [unclassified Agromyces]|uniref:FHA domain-containing protein n=1 Tax=unclassified Agromyces TaxID=2639701 RepID=UPI003014CBEA
MSDFIVPPPGLVPDAPAPAEPERTVRVPDRVPAFRPVAPGLPPVPRPGPRTAWRLRADGGGDGVTVTGRVVVGRDPRATDAAAGADPVAIDDPARSLSKTHALLEVVDDRLLVTDLGSTNGVRIWPDGEEAIELESGRPTSVPAGAVLLLGDVAFLVDRAPDGTV